MWQDIKMPEMNKLKLHWLLQAFIWVECIWEFYVILRQYWVVVKVRKIPKPLRSVTTPEMFILTRRYTLDKLRYDMVRLTYSTLYMSAMLYFGFPSKFWMYVVHLKLCTSEMGLNCMWLAIDMIVQALIAQVPIAYRILILERRYGCNGMNITFYVWDRLKSFILKMLVTLPLCAVTVYIVRHTGPLYPIWLWMVTSLISFVLITLYPALIAPLFDTYRPLHNGRLRDRIKKLTGAVRFPLARICVLESANPAGHGNAFLYGFFYSKRIVIYDTLIDGRRPDALNSDEVLGVLAHELGHWHHNHIVKNVITAQINLLITFLCFAYFSKMSVIYECVGFRRRMRPILPALMLVTHFILTPYNVLTSYYISWQSRRFERQADAFSIPLKQSCGLSSALVKMYRFSMQFPVYDRLYIASHLSHPPILDRLQGLRNLIVK